MFGLQPLHVIVIFVVGMLVFGPKRMPEMARYIGKMLNEFRAGTQDFSQILQGEISRPIKHDVAPPESQPLVSSDGRKVCSNCTTPYSEQARFCGRCGLPIPRPETVVAESAEASASDAVATGPHGSVLASLEEPATPVSVSSEPPIPVSPPELAETLDAAPPAVVIAGPHGSFVAPPEELADEAISAQPDAVAGLSPAEEQSGQNLRMVAAAAETAPDEPEIVMADAQNFCLKCATPNKANARFCVRCGATLASSESAVTELAEEVVTEPAVSQESSVEAVALMPSATLISDESSHQGQGGQMVVAVTEAIAVPDEPIVVMADAQNFCLNCATPNTSQARFCARCGAPLRKPEEAAPVKKQPAKQKAKRPAKQKPEEPG